MIGQPIFSFKFKRRDGAKTIGISSAVKVALDTKIDLGLLFQRFLVVSRTGSMCLEEVMTHELSAYKPAPF